MGKQKSKEALEDDLINVSDGALLVSTASDLDKEARDIRPRSETR
jgi:hypothetical protein